VISNLQLEAFPAITRPALLDVVPSMRSVRLSLPCNGIGAAVVPQRSATKRRRNAMRTTLTIGAAAAVALALTQMPATAATTYRVTVTCSVPKSQPERQLSPSSCLNYLPDGTQTYVAHVRDGSGRPVAGVSVKWSASDTRDAHFRLAQNPCTTDSKGVCQAELKDTHPKHGETITVTATAGGSSGHGTLTFK
jgi:hypothetical protein